MGVIDSDLDGLQQGGVSVLRWFILADGLTCGHGGKAPRLDSAGAWRFDSPQLDEPFVADFGWRPRGLTATLPEYAADLHETRNEARP